MLPSLRSQIGRPTATSQFPSHPTEQRQFTKSLSGVSALLLAMSADSAQLAVRLPGMLLLCTSLCPLCVCVSPSCDLECPTTQQTVKHQSLRGEALHCGTAFLSGHHYISPWGFSPSPFLSLSFLSFIVMLGMEVRVSCVHAHTAVTYHRTISQPSFDPFLGSGGFAYAR